MQQFIVLLFVLTNGLGESICHADKVDTDGGYTSDTSTEDGWEYDTEKENLFRDATTLLKNGEQRRSVFLGEHKGNKGKVGLSDLYLSDKRAHVYEEEANNDEHNDNDVDGSFGGGSSLPVNDEDDGTDMRNTACKSRARKRGWGSWEQKIHILHVNI